jgi:transposase
MSQWMEQARKIDSIRTNNPMLHTDAEINGTPCNHGTSDQEVFMISLLKRHEIQVLLSAGHLQTEVAQIAGVSVRTVRRVAEEPEVENVDDRQERQTRGVGRPSKVEEYREFVKELIEKEPGLMSLEVLRRAREKGYGGGKTVMYELIAALRPRRSRILMRFEGLPGEFSQHDFGQVDIRFLDGTCRRVHFFASRLKWSRWVEVTLVDNECTETLVRTLAEHFSKFGGVPLCAIFDQAKTVVVRWKSTGEVEEWNSTFAYAALELGFTADVCWPYQPQQKGSVESLVKWVKGSFFKQRRFHDHEDLVQQLAEWLREVNCERPSRATGEVPARRIEEERPRLRPLRVSPENLSLRVPLQVGPTAEVYYAGRGYTMPAEAAGLPATLYLYRDRIHVVAGSYEAEHPRHIPKGTVSRLPEHRAAHLAAVSGARGKRYLKRQHLFETGEAAVEFLTELVHRYPRGWSRDVDELHGMLQAYGPEKMEQAFRAALQAGIFSVRFVAQCLGYHGRTEHESVRCAEVLQ